jgi:DNA-binding transcriptional MerR regulator
MTAAETSYRIGDVAEAVGLTPRTIRYYEELGLLDTGERGERAKGSHRQYTEADIERLRELVRLRDLLGLTLEELTALAETTEVSRCLRSQWAASTGDDERLRIVRAAIPNVQRQLELVHARQRNLADFETELVEKLGRMRTLLAELERD